MNAFSRQLFRGLAATIVSALALRLTSLAQPAPAEKSTPPAGQTPPAATAPDTTPTPAPNTPPPAENQKDDKSNLRRLDQPQADAAVPSSTEPVRRERRRRGSNGGEFPFGDHTVPQGSQMREVFSILGNTTVGGEVDSDAVSVGGSTQIEAGAKVGGAAVAVLGHLESAGDVRDKAVSVLGSSEINGHVGGEAVSVLGNMHLGPKAVIDGDIVVVGGKLTREPGAVVNGNQVNVPILGAFGDAEWLTTWMKRCLVYGRPLAFGAHLGWAWTIAFSFLTFYLLLALLFPTGVVKCAETLERRPGYSVLTSVLTVLLTPVAIVLLAITVVGALLVPFLGAGLFFAGLFGKTVMLGWIGRRFTKFFGDGPLGHPAFAVLIGGLIVLLIYTVPIVGFLTFKLLSWLGLGVVVFTIALSMKRDKPLPAAATTTPESVPLAPEPPAPASTVPMAPATSEPVGFAPTSMPATDVPVAPKVSSGFVGLGSVTDVPGVPPVGPAPEPPRMVESPPPVSAPTPPPAASAVPPSPPPPPVRSSMTGSRPTVAPAVVWPRANLLIRLGALALDGILLGLIMAFISGLLPRILRFHDGPGGWLIALAIYGAVMWKHKGTTIGGIVCGLKVVRVDNREIDWATAIVRALGCFLSLAVVGLGFIWVAIDDEKLSWHDKIAGTAVVRVPKGVSLL